MAIKNTQIFLMPVLPAVRQYLVKSHIGAPYEATKESYLGMWLINAMVKKNTRAKSWNWDECRGNGLTAGWKFVMPLRYEHRCVLPATRVADFNHMIMKMIHVEIIQDIETRKAAGHEDAIIPAIEAFWERYEIWDFDLPDETIRKMYYRFRKTQEEKKSRPLAALILENIR